MSTSITKLLGIRTPIVTAPMGFAVTSEMIKQVIDAGGFPHLPVVFSTAAELASMLDTIRVLTSIPKPTLLPIGVGFIGWILDRLPEADADTLLETALDQSVAIWLAFGVDLGKYARKVREYDARKHRKTLLFVMVNSVEAALKAAGEWKADVIVAQGFEAGGHGHANSPTTISLVQGVLLALPAHRPSVIAAGGITTGAQIAAYLTLGADGVVIGSRLLFSHECEYTAAMKEELIKADLHGTIRSYAFDDVFRTAFWPEGIDARALKNKIIDDYKEGLSLEVRLQRYDDDKANGRSDRLAIWAGEGVGLLGKIEYTKDIIEQLHQDTIKTLRRAASLVE